MSKGVFKHIRISGLCAALPSNCYDTRELTKDMNEKAVKRFIKSTGVEKRFLSLNGQTTSDLCFIAADKLIEQRNVVREDIDALIFISQNPDYKRPSTAIILQERLKLRKSCMAFDINLGCSGYVYGLYVLAGMLEGGAIKKALLLAGDVNYDLPGELLFGDGGSATLLECGSDVLEGILQSDGSGYRAIYTPEGGQRHPLNRHNPDWEAEMPKMNGTDVFEFTITQVPELLEEFNRCFQKKFSDYDYIILHQANLMMLNHIIRKLKIPTEKVPITIQKYGNVSSASIPISIADLCTELENKHEKIRLLLSGFGVGLSLGVVSIQLVPEVVLPIVRSDYVWDEKFDGGCSR
ncbi:MAG: ketoacyl-ACP synthase III [Bacteroidales bacterium]|nr:ketoacyl-ACP synthase III [Clostridium sp.]MCM1203852.1 ketoacyl-ACP synthase III [Bacteroidales bacterium]